MNRLAQKHSGSYYTPEAIVACLLKWAVHGPRDCLLDPSCGDGRFIAGHRNSVGIEQDVEAARVARGRAPHAVVHTSEFFEWASTTDERFECAVGNPPFIRYQTFRGDVRERALTLSLQQGAKFSGLTSSWAPFLVAAASLLRRGGRMAFVVPAEIGHAPYAAPLISYLTDNFSVVHVIAIRDKLFPDLSEDCWLLYADGYGSRTAELRFSTVSHFRPSAKPPRRFERILVDEWRGTWRQRLRPYLICPEVRDLYRLATQHPKSVRLGDIAAVGIGYVSGSNDFFHLRPSIAEHWRIPPTSLHPTVRNGRALPQRQLTKTTVDRWLRSDEPVLLLRLPKTSDVPSGVRRYLDTKEAETARQAYKCRTRDPWYSVPDVQVPDFFLSYMSGLTPNLVFNAAGCTCANSVHAIRVRDRQSVKRLVQTWDLTFTQLSCELEGHALGGGMLKLEPKEAAQIVLPPRDLFPELIGRHVDDAIAMMRRWRHYAA